MEESIREAFVAARREDLLGDKTVRYEMSEEETGARRGPRAGPGE